MKLLLSNDSDDVLESTDASPARYAHEAVMKRLLSAMEEEEKREGGRDDMSLSSVKRDPWLRVF